MNMTKKELLEKLSDYTLRNELCDEDKRYISRSMQHYKTSVYFRVY